MLFLNIVSLLDPAKHQKISNDDNFECFIQDKLEYQHENAI